MTEARMQARSARAGPASGTEVISEGELVARLAAGDPGSVRELYRTYGRTVYTVALRVLGDAVLAEHATQRTFARARNLASSFDADHGLERWLATIAGRTAIEIHCDDPERTNQATPRSTEAEPPDPATVAEQIDDVWLVRRAIDMLTDQDREFIRLQHSLQLTPMEISDRLDVPLASVRSGSHGAHRRLGDALLRCRWA